MSNIEITHIDTGSPLLADGQFQDALLKFSAAETYKAGTVLAFDTTVSRVVPFVVGGPNGTGIPSAVLTHDLTAEAAGDVAARVLIAGTVIRERLIIHADGNGDNVDDAIITQLRDLSIIVQRVTQLAHTDNS